MELCYASKLIRLPYLLSIIRTRKLLIENWNNFFFMLSQLRPRSENTELKQAMLKLNTTFILQHFVLLHHRA